MKTDLQKRPIYMKRDIQKRCVYAVSYAWVTAHVWMRHVSQTWMSQVTSVIESRHTYEWFMSRTYEWVMSHVWLSHVTCMIESRHMCEWVTPRVWMSPAELIRMCDMACHLFACAYLSFACVIWRIHVWDHWLVRICDTTYLFAWHDWRIHKRDQHTSYSHVCYDVFMCLR